MDLSKLSDDDLIALRDKNMKGMSDEGLKYLSSLRAPTVSNAPKEDTGATGAFKSSLESIKGELGALAGKTGLMDQAEAEKYYKEQKEKAATLAPTEKSWSEAPIQKLKETAAGSVPYMVAPLAAGAAAALGGAPALVGGLGAGLVSGAQFTGSNLGRQMEEGKTLEEASLGKAAAAAIPQAALDVVGFKYIPGIQKIFASVGKQLTEQEALNIMKQGTLRTAGQYIAGGTKIAGIEGATEAGQQFFERLQAGLNLNDAQARQEYLDNFIGGAALGAVASPFGVHGTRADAQKVIQEKQAERDVAAQKAAQEQEAQTAFQEQQAKTGQITGEAVPTEKEISPLPNAPSTLTAAERMQQEEDAAKKQQEDTAATLRQHQVLKNEVDTLQEQVAKAAEQGNVEAITTLSPRLQQMQAAYKTSQETIKKLSPVEQAPEVQMAELRGKLKQKIAQLQKAGGVTGDFEKINKVATEIKDIQTKIDTLSKAGTQFDLFEPAKMEAEDKAARQQQAEQRQQEQADLFAQLPQKETVGPLDKYQEGLQELEDAHAAGADERTVSEIVDRLRQAALDKEATKAKIGKTESADETERRNANIANLKEQLALAKKTNNKELADVVEKRLSILEEESGVGRTEVAKEDAVRAQSDALNKAVESVRSILSGAYFNSFNPVEASTMKSGLENQVRDAGSAYIKSALEEVNADRVANKQETLSTDESLKLAMALKGRFEHLAGDPTFLSEKKRAINLPMLEATLGKIKDNFRQGKSRLTRVQPFFTSKERDAAQLLKTEKAKANPDNTRIRFLEKEVAANKAEDERIAAEKARKEANAEVDVSNIGNLATDEEKAARNKIAKEKQYPIDQQSLFGEKELEPIATTRANTANFMKFVNIQATKFQHAKQQAEAAIAAAAKRGEENKAKNDARATEDANELLRQIDAQRAVVKEIENADRIISNLRGQATRLWQERGNLVKAIKTANKDSKKIIKNAIDRIDETSDERMQEIDALHKQANKLKEANIDVERAILASLERAYAKTPDGKNKAAVAKARAMIGAEEAAVEEALAKQVKEKRQAEEEQAVRLKGLPTKGQKQVVISTDKFGLENKKVVKVITEKAFPKTEAEKMADVRAIATEGARERAADKKAIAERLEKGLSGDLATAKSNLTYLEKRMRELSGRIKADQKKIVDLNKAIEYAKSPEKKATWQAQLDKLTKGMAARDLETTVVSIEKAIKELHEKGVSAERTLSALGNRPEKTTKAKPLVRRKDVTKEGMKAVRDVEAEAKEAGVSYDDYHDIMSGMEFGFKARMEPSNTRTGLSQESAQKVVDATKIPKGVDVKVIAILPEGMKQYIREQGYDPDTIKGFVTANGKIVVVAVNHANTKEVEQTLAHEITGHMGVDGVLGKDGMYNLAAKIDKQEGGILGLAKKLGVGDDAQGAYDAAKASGKSEEDARIAAVSEMIAHVAEMQPTKSNMQKAKDFIEALVGALRAGLRKMGIKLDINTNDVYKLLSDARKDFEITPGAHVTSTGNIQFSGKPSYNSKFSDLGKDISKVVSTNKTTADKIKAAASGMKVPSDIMKPNGPLGEKTWLKLRTRYIDRFAPIEKVANKLSEKFKDSLVGTQLMYYLRMHDQNLNWTAQIASGGPIDMIQRKRADGKTETILESKDGASLLKVSQALKKADVGDANAAKQLFTFYLAAKRAQRVGLDTLNFDKSVTQPMLDKVVSRINSDPQTKAAFEEAAKIYNDYNKGMIDFAVKTGRFSKEDAAKLLEAKDYVPFYRTRPDGSVIMDIGGATVINIGNISDQPYLHELVGGDTAILDVFTSSLQNTRMLTDMALRNLATRNVAFSLQQLGLLQKKKGKDGKEIGSGIYEDKGNSPANDSTIRFMLDGKKHYAVVDTDSIGIPADLLVKGMDGVQVAIPNLVKVAGVPARMLRSFITRNPAYAVRQIARDSLSNAFTTGADSIPIMDNMKQLGSMLRGVNEGELILKRRGILGGQVIGGASDSMQKAMLQIIDGKPGWSKAMAGLDHLAMMGDASSRVTSYNSFIKQGLSDMEATLASLEAMNFSKRGTSPSFYLLNQMVPFLNAQIQGLDVLYKAFAGKMPFNEKLKIKEKLLKRGAMMAGMTMAYTALMYDDDSYKNATPQERIGNWFVKLPGMDEPVRVPIPFEIGGIFKMLPEMLYSTAFEDKKLGDAAKEIAAYSLNQFVPSVMPTIAKPFVELPANYSFFTGKPIEGARLQKLEPGMRANANTPEMLKALGEATNISPVKMEYLLRTYTGALPLAMMTLANPVTAAGEAPEGRGVLSSTTPIVGAFFQPKDATGLIEKAYEQMGEVQKAQATYKDLVENDREKEADAFLDKEADLIGMARFAGQFNKKMGDLAKQEREVRSMTGISGAEKRQMLDEIRQIRIEMSKDFLSARE